MRVNNNNYKLKFNLFLFYFQMVLEGKDYFYLFNYKNQDCNKIQHIKYNNRILNYKISNDKYIKDGNKIKTLIEYNGITKLDTVIYLDNINEDLFNELYFHKAITEKNNYLVKLLISKGIDINIKNFGGTPLHTSIIHNNLKVIKLLISKGVDINLKNHLSNTPLHTSIDFDNLEAMKLLIANGAKLDEKNSLGETPLLLAIKNKNLEAIDLLTANGVKLNLKYKIKKFFNCI